jgi:phage terminase small subunit
MAPPKPALIAGFFFWSRKMRERRRLFVLEYLVDLNGQAAAKRAGYAEGKAGGRAWELLQRADVQAMIRAEMSKREDRLRITADRILLEYGRIAFSNIARIAQWDAGGLTLLPPDRMSEDDSAAVKSVSIGGRKGSRAQRFALHDKLTALDALARYVGLSTRGKGGRQAMPPHVPLMDPETRVEANRRLAILVERKAKELLEMAASSDGTAKQTGDQ